MVLFLFYGYLLGIHELILWNLLKHLTWTDKMGKSIFSFPLFMELLGLMVRDFTGGVGVGGRE